MPFTHTITQTTTYDDGAVNVSKPMSDAQTAGEEHNIAESIADGQTDLLVAYTLDFSQAKTFVMWPTVAMTIKTNSSGTPAQTFVLSAFEPVVWSAGQTAVTNPITTDITALYVTNASGAAGILNIRSLQDPTV